MKLRNFITGLLFAILLLNGCTMAKIESLKKTRDIVIDGNDKDWMDAKYYIEDKNIVLGVMNDTENLYICFYPTTQEQTQMILTRGCTLWIDNEGKRNKENGIHFPLGIQFGKPQKPKEIFNDLSAGKPDSFNPKMTKNLLNKIPRELEIINFDKTTRYKFKDIEGVELAIDSYKSLFAYEMKIPLQRNNETTFAANTEPGSTIAIGIEIPKLDTKNMKSKMQKPEGGMPGGGPGNMPGGGMNGEKGGGMMPENSAKINGLDLWLKVELMP